ncbi:MAG TPA: hypothetical protein VJ806_05375 [Luteimonas sp.]|nr:hypothetical protein [Luteimonas sp.]
MFTLLPAIAGFLIASRKQKRTHRALAGRLEDLRSSLAELQSLRRIEHEVQTMNRLTKVAREAVKNTASSAQELLGAIRAVNDPYTRERLVDRYRTHTNNVATVLSAVGEQLEESGISIYSELNAESEIHVLEREKANTASGLEYAREIMKQRGIEEGRDQLRIAFEQASLLQAEVISLTALEHAPEAANGEV